VQRNIVKTSGILLVVLLLLGVSLGAVMGPRKVGRRLERAWLLVTGHLIDVNGHRIQLECRGSGSPTVVMDSGLNMTLDSWGKVPADVAAFTRVCTYNRSGLGYSDSGPKPRTSKTIVNELETLLVNGGIRGPYVLVGHSFGGLNVRLYASQHPDKVAGIVLIDASHENQYQLLAALKSEAERQEYLQHEGGGNFEGVDLLASAAELRGAPPFPSVPLLVLTPGRREHQDTKEAQVMEQMQAELAKLAPNGKQIIVENSSHFIQLDRPLLVADSIFVVVRAAREHSATANGIGVR
jgi:pimeloyl-ACP methyl ester carboxylesterase